ncbi:pyridoxamine 5'-phosphate oxidase family protein [Streptomyces yaizuensis]|uniref:Pyridoxamine 5'-phosphate oxidase family protein n=1 Tax=Streptomyces yaizuensis TaxID=2989713 RepID=A0ABQ5P215_9ACTN|nr:pyridoxamine 5'-phosphate oxidase family protein [Streptomyces sp. YSPA8]GLF96649.1 pyridoxamine 5'-phosphate oxidase family protein [Streptomyces sp. YSPA8]
MPIEEPRAATTFAPRAVATFAPRAAIAVTDAVAPLVADAIAVADEPEELRGVRLLTGVSYGRLATSMRAMPFVAPARHIVRDDQTVLLRIHRGFGYHRACNGSVVAYGADNFNSGGRTMWSVQFTGLAQIVVPTEEDLRRFGDEPLRADGERFEPVHLHIEPQFVTVHTLDYREEQHNRHSE